MLRRQRQAHQRPHRARRTQHRLDQLEQLIAARAETRVQLLAEERQVVQCLDVAERISDTGHSRPLVCRDGFLVELASSRRGRPFVRAMRNPGPESIKPGLKNKLSWRIWLKMSDSGPWSAPFPMACRKARSSRYRL